MGVHRLEFESLVAEGWVEACTVPILVTRNHFCVGSFEF